MVISKFWLRVCGIFGILGALVLFSGDMLFYYDSVQENLKINMANASDLRIKLSTITALFASWFYLLGLVPVYYAFAPTTQRARNTVLISFAAILVAYGVIHGAYVAIATTSKLAMQNNLDISQATMLASDANMLLRLFIYPVFAIFSFVFIKQVWQNKTHYPRWIIFFFPLVPFLFQGLLKMMLTGSLKTIIMGGFLNIILFIFFTASTVALWKYPLNKEK